MIELNEVEARVLGSLSEKSATTPELYPLTFNALLNACNQKTSRDPVMTLDVDALGRAAQSLIGKGLVERLQYAGDRVPKFKHFISKLVDGDDEKVIGAITVLLLRGPQTPGEIKGRTDRLCTFESSAEVDALLQSLAARAEGPLVARLPRSPGQKETRYRHLFTPSDMPVETGDLGPRPTPTPHTQPSPDRLSELEKRVALLEATVQKLQLEKAA